MSYVKVQFRISRSSKKHGLEILKVHQKEQFRKQQKQQVILLEVKLLVKITSKPKASKLCSNSGTAEERPKDLEFDNK